MRSTQPLRTAGHTPPRRADRAANARGPVVLVPFGWRRSGLEIDPSPRRARALRLVVASAALVASALVTSPARAFWVVNFGPADTLAPGKVGFAAGVGGQAVFTGSPVKANAFFMIPHAGFRLGLAEPVDMGLRLAPVPLPFSSVGPGFGMNVDAKVRLTPAKSSVGVALIAGAGAAHVLVLGDNRAAVSPNGAALVSFRMNDTTKLTFMGRYVFLGIPTASGGISDNFVHIAGASVGLKIQVLPNIAVLPEVGAYWYEGRIADVRQAGPGGQYGIMLATSF